MVLGRHADKWLPGASGLKHTSAPDPSSLQWHGLFDPHTILTKLAEIRATAITETSIYSKTYLCSTWCQTQERQSSAGTVRGEQGNQMKKWSTECKDNYIKEEGAKLKEKQGERGKKEKKRTSVTSNILVESCLDCKEIKPVNPEGSQTWIFIGRTDAEAEAPILWPPDVKSRLIEKDPDAGKDWGQEEKGW